MKNFILFLFVFLGISFLPVLTQAQNWGSGAVRGYGQGSTQGQVQGRGIIVEKDYTATLDKKPSPVVVELFSSQGCPACPPADEYMGTLAKSDGVIALSCHVDYFGKQSAGLGQKFCTDRQTKYIRQIKRKSHYTPQMMVNGHMNVIGYETQEVAAKIVKGRAEHVGEIIIQPQASGVYKFSISDRRFSGSVDLMLISYDKPHRVSYRGKITTYYNVIDKLIPLGTWQGGAINRAVFPLVNNNHAGFAIIAQDKKSGKILAAGNYKL